MPLDVSAAVSPAFLYRFGLPVIPQFVREAEINLSGSLYFEVPLSRMLTIENSVKQMPPSPANTRAGT